MTNEVKHTPGPWEVESWNDREIVKGCGRYVATISRDVPSIEDRKANARLIAASPALLSALVDVMGWFDSAAVRNLMTKQGYQSECSRIINEARAAIAKATQGTK